MIRYSWPTYRFNRIITEFVKQETVYLVAYLTNMMQVHETQNT